MFHVERTFYGNSKANTKTNMSFAHLASFQATEFVDRPILKTFDIILYVRWAYKTGIFSKRSSQNTAFWKLGCLRRASTWQHKLSLSHSHFPQLTQGTPGTMIPLLALKLGLSYGNTSKNEFSGWPRGSKYDSWRTKIVKEYALFQEKQAIPITIPIWSSLPTVPLVLCTH